MDLGLGTPSQTLENDAKTDSGINVEGDDESQTPVPGDGNVTPKRKDLTREVQTNQDSNDSHLSKSSGNLIKALGEPIKLYKALGTQNGQKLH